MKYTYTFISIIALLVLSQSLFAQGGTDQTITQNPLNTQPRGNNVLTKAQYQQITYNGYTIEQLNSIAGDEELLYDIFGSPTSKKVSSFGNISYSFYGFSLGYFTETPQDYISGFTSSTTSALTVKVLGKTIQVGDSFEELTHKFGENLKIVFMPELSDNIIVIFTYMDNEYDGLQLYLDKSTYNIQEIVYFVNP
ncbi:MAG: hypothetical protein JJ892_13830 [Balneola sp.]|nr:hypothetical protein [Balneola sp.]MBO6651997.1 hypothetical protein [Balneola sp.]MBO6712689.1 hypothetical protein [Balneola sp.]MBO6801351.1 hypothetical protein [Balneola sp.]MBO6870490.1 hypothetical protein [Balneola sp.]